MTPLRPALRLPMRVWWPLLLSLSCGGDAPSRRGDPGVADSAVSVDSGSEVPSDGDGSDGADSGGQHETGIPADSGDSGLVPEDLDGDGWTVEEGDCDDAAPEIHPDAEDLLCDGIDNDCSGDVPEVFVLDRTQGRYTSLESAAAALREDDTLWVCPGEHEVSGHLVGTPPFTLAGWTQDQADVVLRPPPSGPLDVVVVAEDAGRIILQDLTFTRPQFAADAGAGCVVGIDAPLDIRNSRFEECLGQYGAVVGSYSNDSAGRVVVHVEGSTFVGNVQGGPSLGGPALAVVYSDWEDVLEAGSVAVLSSVFEENSHPSVGAVYLEGVHATIDGCSFARNTGVTTDGLELVAGATTGRWQWTLTDLEFTDQTGGRGLDISTLHATNVLIRDVRFVNNSTTSQPLMYVGPMGRDEASSILVMEEVLFASNDIQGAELLDVHVSSGDRGGGTLRFEDIRFTDNNVGLAVGDGWAMADMELSAGQGEVSLLIDEWRCSGNRNECLTVTMGEEGTVQVSELYAEDGSGSREVVSITSSVISVDTARFIRNSATVNTLHLSSCLGCASFTHELHDVEFGQGADANTVVYDLNACTDVGSSVNATLTESDRCP